MYSRGAVKRFHLEPGIISQNKIQPGESRSIQRSECRKPSCQADGFFRGILPKSISVFVDGRSIGKLLQGKAPELVAKNISNLDKLMGVARGDKQVGHCCGKISAGNNPGRELRADDEFVFFFGNK